MRIINHLLFKIDVVKEDITRFIWNASPHEAECIICGDKMVSTVDKYSPQESGWLKIKGSSKWVCHSCSSHRIFKPYIEIIDLDNEVLWYNKKYSHRSFEEIKKERSEVINNIEKFWDKLMGCVNENNI